MFTKVLFTLILAQYALDCAGDKGSLLYSNSLASAKDVSAWTMEGPGELLFKNGWMTMFSPDQQMHHVFWCPEEFPNSFIAEWQVQNLHTKAGLAIVFFAAKGINGEALFSPQLKPRDGTFKQYVQGDIRSYHISYYANAAHNKDRGYANLRKNNTFTLLQTGKEGIPTLSTAIHRLRLQKTDRRIQMWVDDKSIIDFTDQDEQYWTTGKIGLRQMKWSQLRYRNFKVWAFNETKNATNVNKLNEAIEF
ncbi:protein of unknown function [Alteromonadaceae bacterium Bs31]|nr:protein of unknown function [Alteromonadaceae bacterium Bs31]